MAFRSRCMYVCIFLFAFAVRYGYSMQTDYTTLVNDERNYNRLAHSLLERQTFIRNGVDTVRPPLYPFVIAAIYSCTGRSLHAVMFVQCLLGALTCLCIAGAAGKATGSRRWAWAAGWLSAGYYGLLHMPANLLTETLVTFWLALVIWLLIDSPRARVKYLLGGIVCGLAVLTRSNFLLLPLLLILWYGWNWLIHKRSIVPGLLFVLGCCIVVTPWTVRNYFVHHSFVPVNIQAGTVFWGAHTPLSRGGWISPHEVFPDTVKTLHGLSLVERNRRQLGEGLNYLRSLSSTEIAGLISLKLYWLLFPSLDVYDVTFVLLAPFMLAGMLRHTPTPSILWLVLITGLLATLVFYGSPRFRGPLSPALLVFAVFGLRWYFSCMSSRTRAFVTCGIWTALNAALFYLEAIVDYDFGVF